MYSVLSGVQHCEKEHVHYMWAALALFTLHNYIESP